MKKFIRSLHHYLPLIGILAAGLIGILTFSTDITFQQVIIFATAAGYVSWGIVHHMAHKDLTFSILVEYFAVAVFGLVVVFSILFRA